MMNTIKKSIASIPVIGPAAQWAYRRSGLRHGTKEDIKSSAPRIAIGYSTMERTHFTLRTVRGLDADERIDIFWCDGSASPAARKVPSPKYFKRARLKEIHYDITGGADAVIQYALRRMLSLGYDYIGLLENDILLEDGWLPAIMDAFEAGRRDQLRVGAVTTRTIESRILFHRPGYAAMWNMGAGMVIFTREAVEAVLADYHTTGSQSVGEYWKQWGFDLDAWELWMDQPNRGLGADWWYAVAMMNKGLVCIGSVPSLADNIDVDLEDFCRTTHSRRSLANEPLQSEAYELFMSKYSPLKSKVA